MNTEINLENNEENRAEDVCACCRHKNTPRGAEEQKKLQNRINRIIGQLGGIQNMIEDNRYCGDILIQIAAVESALQNLGYIVLQDHLETCVVEEIRKGNTEIIAEAVDMIKKLK
jgi:DNA-binding FrmR family transcriptional regulator